MKTFILFILFVSSVNLSAQTQVGCWLFSGNTADSSGMGNHGTIAGTDVALTTDRFNNPNSAYTFYEGRVNIGSTNGFPTGNEQRTMCAWFKRNTINSGSHQYIFSIGDNGVNGCRSSIDVENQNNWVGNENRGAANFTTWQNDTNWHFLCAVFPEGGTVSGDYQVYFDGVLAPDTSLLPSTPINTNTSSPAIGCLGTINGYFFYGKIDDVRLYSTALTASQILELYNAPPAMTTLLSPANNSVGLSLTPLLDWSVSPFTSSYRVLLSADSTFATTLLDSTTNVDSLSVPSGLLTNNVKYYWKVRAINLGGKSPYTESFNFIPSPVATLGLKLFIQGFYRNITNSMVRDTLRIYLHNNFSPYSIVDSSKAYLDSLGNANFTFTNVLNGVNYYISTKHRNTIETWSKSPGQSFSSNFLSYNFSSAASQAFGNNMKQIDVSPVRFGIYSGDANQDGTIDLSDMSLIDNDAYGFVSGYVKTDLTGDDFVDLDDLSIADNNAFNFISKIIP